jgi:hypothetical protein
MPRQIASLIYNEARDHRLVIFDRGENSFSYRLEKLADLSHLPPDLRSETWAVHPNTHLGFYDSADRAAAEAIRDPGWIAALGRVMPKSPD